VWPSLYSVELLELLAQPTIRSGLKILPSDLTSNVCQSNRILVYLSIWVDWYPEPQLKVRPDLYSVQFLKQLARWTVGSGLKIWPLDLTEFMSGGILIWSSPINLLSDRELIQLIKLLGLTYVMGNFHTVDIWDEIPLHVIGIYKLRWF